MVRRRLLTAYRRPALRRPPFRSPLRTGRLTAHLGLMLAVAFGVCFLTGLLSHLIQHPPGWFVWPSRPVNLYRITQGLHVATGLASIPLLAAKLWSVYPRLFTWPPVRNPLHAVERLSVAALVAASLFQLVTGVLNVSRWYAAMPFFFPAAHYWTAWLAAGAILTHIGVHLPTIRDALSRPTGESANARGQPTGLPDLPTGLPDLPTGLPDLPTGLPDQPTGLPDQPTGEQAQPTVVPNRPAAGLTRRGLLGAVGASAGVVTAATIGQSVAPLSGIALLAPRLPRVGPQRLPVNRSALAAGVVAAAADPAYRLRATGPARTVLLSLADLAALPQHTADLPIACVEGWSAGATWTGVRLRDLAELCGLDPRLAAARVESLQRVGRWRASTVAPPHLRDPLTLLALRLGGEPLHPDHGFPCRLIAPNRPGVLQTKWVARVEFREIE